MKNEVLESLIQEQFKLKFQHGVGRLAKTHLLKEIRKKIARQKTLDRQAQLKQEL